MRYLDQGSERGRSSNVEASNLLFVRIRVGVNTMRTGWNLQHCSGMLSVLMECSNCKFHDSHVSRWVFEIRGDKCVVSWALRYTCTDHVSC